jgi:predicted  nucleic acid-binding Zn-ribbon protein
MRNRGAASEKSSLREFRESMAANIRSVEATLAYTEKKLAPLNDELKGLSNQRVTYTKSNEIDVNNAKTKIQEIKTTKAEVSSKFAQSLRR